VAERGSIVETHTVTLSVFVTMTKMQGTPEESAEIAACIVEEAIALHWDANAEVAITSCGAQDSDTMRRNGGA
jgi:hypothetical protein